MECEVGSPRGEANVIAQRSMVTQVKSFENFLMLIVSQLIHLSELSGAWRKELFSLLRHENRAFIFSLYDYSILYRIFNDTFSILFY